MAYKLLAVFVYIITQVLTGIIGDEAVLQTAVPAKNDTTVGFSVEKEVLTYQVKSGENITWPDRSLVTRLEGDVILGGLMMVHERSPKLICGPIMAQGGLQALEMMLYTIDYVNSIPGFLPGIKLGAHIKDDCDRDTYGLEQSVDFIRGSISNIGGQADCSDAAQVYKNIVGVVAAASSVTSIQVANLLKLFHIPQVSFFSTSAELSSIERYPYFMRTIPSDDSQARAMVKLVKLFGWTYVSLLYEESSYGVKGIQTVEEHLKSNGVCVAVRDVLIKDSGVAGKGRYDKTVKSLLEKRARGVIVFGSDQEVGQLMQAIRRNNASGQFSWIGSDGWGARELAYKGNEYAVEGAVTVQPLAQPVQGFDEYFLALRPENNSRNPWFIEYWEDYFQCKYPNTSFTPYNDRYTKPCTPNMTQTLENGYSPELQLQFVSDAVMAFAHAIRNMHKDACGRDYHGLCPTMQPVAGNVLRNYLLDVKFKGLSNMEFRFDKNGDGPSRYRILNFKQTSQGHFEWQEVGRFQDSTLKVDKNKLQFRALEPVHPTSVCSTPCHFGQARVYLTGDECCWTCVNCSRYQYLASEDKCVYCQPGSLPDKLKQHCVPIPEEYMRRDSPIAIAAMIYAAAGIIVTLFVIAVFTRHRDTPVVKASGRELSFVLLAGILMCFGMTFVITTKPNDYVCGAQKFGVGFCFSVCYAALLTKTNRIARIFRAGKRTARRPRFISPLSQMIICVWIVMLQIVIGVVWLIFSPPQAGPHYPTRDEHQLVCLSAVGPSYMIGFSYPILLIVICTIYAILTRKIPEAFNESKHIGFAMYTTCIIWLAFVPIYFSTANNIGIRLGTMCFSISLSATVSLVCLFTPKLYIILLHPERNVRQSMMSSKSLSKQNSTSHSRVDSGTQSDAEMELHQRLKPSTSMSSGLSRSTSVTGTQTYSNGTSISTQTLDSVGRVFDDMDVAL